MARSGGFRLDGAKCTGRVRYSTDTDLRKPPGTDSECGGRHPPRADL